MSRICEVCGKGPTVGNNVSKSNIKLKRRWLPNLLKIRAKIDDSVQNVKICTKCLKANKITKIV